MYKRQEIDRCTDSQRQHDGQRREDGVEGEQNVGKNANGSFEDAALGGEPVSYTHLDVYKRQPQRCRQLCEQMPRAMIICGDGTKQELLFEAGLERVDAFVSLTGLDEQNAILSMFAASRGVSKVITKVSRTSLLSLVESAGLESVISPKEITANQIIRYVRAMQNSLGSNVETLYKLVGGRVEALEFRVSPEFSHIGVPLRDLTLKPNLLLACRCV